MERQIFEYIIIHLNGNATYDKNISKCPRFNNHATFSFSVSLYFNVFVQKHFLAHKFDSFKFYVGINYKLWNGETDILKFLAFLSSFPLHLKRNSLFHLLIWYTHRENGNVSRLEMGENNFFKVYSFTNGLFVLSIPWLFHGHLFHYNIICSGISILHMLLLMLWFVINLSSLPFLITGDIRNISRLYFYGDILELTW